MKVIFRVDASIEIGTGHVMRCLTLAKLLRERGAEVSFICRELTGNLNDLIETNEFNVHRLKSDSLNEDSIEQITDHSHWLTVHWESDALDTLVILKNEIKIDWLIIDHYAIDQYWEKKIRTFVKKIMVIDDLADRKHVCHLLLDQNFYNNYKNRYEGLVPNDCLKLLGPQYVLLRSEFKNSRLKYRKRDGNINRILLYFGGIDLTNETTKALEAIYMLKEADIKVDVVVGSACPYINLIKKLCSGMPNITFYCQVPNMADLMAKADLAIGAGGITTWERCYLGLPSITIITAKNQANVLTALNNVGAVWNIGYSEEVLPKDIFKKISEALVNPDLVRKMSAIGRALMKNKEQNERYLMFKLLEEDNAAN